MKKTTLSLALIAMTSFSIISCNKIVDEIKKKINPFDYNAPAITIDLPESIAAGQTYKSEDQTYDLNINEILDENTDGVNVSINDISKITLKKVTLKLENTDENNNWSNFEEANVVANTDKGKADNKPDLSGSIAIGTSDAEKYSEKLITFADNNLKEYVNGEGTKVFYTIAAKVKKNVTKPMKMVAVIQYSFKP